MSTMSRLKMVQATLPTVAARWQILITICMVLVARPGCAGSGAGGPSLDVHGAVIMDVFSNRNIDSTFPHDAARTGNRSPSTGGQSWLAASGVLGNPGGLRLSYCASVDFMGKHTSEFVSLWVQAGHDRWSVRAGKISSLLATHETTLDYDGYYSSGGIQTGVHANLDGVRFQYRPSGTMTYRILVTNEPATNGGPGAHDVHTRRPTVQAAIGLHVGRLSAKLAGHSGAMRLADGRVFDPQALMSELRVTLGRSVTWMLAAFRARSGSQLFTIDSVPDVIPRPGNGMMATAAAGGLSQLIFGSERWDAWAGLGLFTLSGRSRRCLAAFAPEDALLDNRRASIGGRWHVTEDLSVALELSRFSTRHVLRHQIDHVSGSAIQFQCAVTF